jgi:hypothetical protein
MGLVTCKKWQGLLQSTLENLVLLGNEMVSVQPSYMKWYLV